MSSYARCFSIKPLSDGERRYEIKHHETGLEQALLQMIKRYTDRF